MNPIQINLEQIQQEQTMATIIVQRDALILTMAQNIKALQEENEKLKEPKQTEK